MMHQKNLLQAYKKESIMEVISSDNRLTIPVVGVMVTVKQKSAEAGVAVGEQLTAEQRVPVLAHWKLAG